MHVCCLRGEWGSRTKYEEFFFISILRYRGSFLIFFFMIFSFFKRRQTLHHIHSSCFCLTSLIIYAHCLAQDQASSWGREGTRTQTRASYSSINCLLLSLNLAIHVCVYRTRKVLFSSVRLMLSLCDDLTTVFGVVRHAYHVCIGDVKCYAFIFDGFSVWVRAKMI